MNPETSREHRKAALRSTILEAAREIFVREGHESISMRKLAARTGYSAGSLYLYFRNKEELLDCLAAESFDRLATSLAGLKLRHEHKDAVEVLRKALYTYVEFGLRNGYEYRLAVAAGPEMKATANKIQAVVEVLRAMTARCLEEGRAYGADADTATQALWAAVHGVTALILQRPSFPWTARERLVEQVVTSALAGLGPPPQLAELGRAAIQQSVA